MWWWSAGWSWPGFVLMAVFMVICMLIMARMMGSTGGMGMCGLGRRRERRDGADADDHTHRARARTDDP